MTKYHIPNRLRRRRKIVGRHPQWRPSCALRQGPVTGVPERHRPYRWWWAVNQLVLHHHYTYGSTFDVSGFANHGDPQLVTAGTGGFSSALHFGAADSRVSVAPSKSLANPFAVAAMVRFYLEGAPTSRQNLIEGFVSFALFVEPSGALTATIVDSDGAWSGVSSPAGIAATDVWHEAWVSHDGISQMELRLDGTVVARAQGVMGPVQSVGDFGIAIGNWPDAGAYPFGGYIDEVKLYRYNPSKDFQQLLDPCCSSGRRLDAILRELERNAVFGADKPGGRQLLALLARLSALLRGGDSDRAVTFSQLADGMTRALKTRDSHTLAALHEQLSMLAEDAPSADAVRAGREDIQRLIDESGISEDLLLRLAEALCLKVPDKAAEEARSAEA